MFLQEIKLSNHDVNLREGHTFDLAFVGKLHPFIDAEALTQFHIANAEALGTLRKCHSDLTTAPRHLTETDEYYRHKLAVPQH